jgi:hypothetical protein
MQFIRSEEGCLVIRSRIGFKRNGICVRRRDCIEWGKRQVGEPAEEVEVVAKV